jgi:hypothetical protein
LHYGGWVGFYIIGVRITRFTLNLWMAIDLHHLIEEAQHE